MKDKEIIEEFYNQYFRSPQYDEFKACGGKCDKYEYLDLLASVGFYPTRGKPPHTIEVFKHGVLVFTGTVKEVAEEIDMPKLYVYQVIEKNRTTRKGYSLKIKKFKGHL